MEWIRNWMEGMTVEQWAETAIRYYMVLIVIACMFALAVFTYHIYRVIQQLTSGKTEKGNVYLTVSIVRISIYLYLTTAALFGSYLPAMLGGWDNMRFWIPYDLFMNLYSVASSHPLFPFVQIAVIAGAAVVSLIYLLNGLARLLGSNRGGFRGEGSLMMAVILGIVPVGMYALA